MPFLIKTTFDATQVYECMYIYVSESELSESLFVCSLVYPPPDPDVI